MHGFLTAVVSLVAEHRLQDTGFSSCSSWALDTGSVVEVHRLSCSTACGILPDQGLNPCFLHWQADSHPLCHQGSSSIIFLLLFYLFIYGCAWSSLLPRVFPLVAMSEGGYSLVAVLRLLISVTSLIAEHGLQAHRLQELQRVGSVV